jgi:hypothetical protein
VLLATEYYGKAMVEGEPEIIKEFRSSSLIEAFKDIVKFKDSFNVDAFINNFKENGFGKSSSLFEENVVSTNGYLGEECDFQFIDIVENCIMIYFTSDYNDGVYYTIRQHDYVGYMGVNVGDSFKQLSESHIPEVNNIIWTIDAIYHPYSYNHNSLGIHMVANRGGYTNMVDIDYLRTNCKRLGRANSNVVN